MYRTTNPKFKKVFTYWVPQNAESTLTICNDYSFTTALSTIELLILS